MSSREKRSSARGTTPDKTVLDAPPPKKAKPAVKEDLQPLYDMANLLRIDSIEATNVTKSGHPTSCSSIAEILSVLFFHEQGLHFLPDSPTCFLNDRIVLSKGHAAPILYAAFARAGIITRADLLTLRLKNSSIEGHPVPKIPFVDVATGSLGQGLSNAAGMAYSSKYFDNLNNRVFCVMGDGEIAEGSIWEAAAFSSFYKLDNLIGVVDINGLGQSQATMYEHKVEVHLKKWQAFGWNAIKVDGHSIEAIVKALTNAHSTKGVPTVLLALTEKGKYFPGIEGKLDWHGKALGDKTHEVVDHLLSKITNKELVLQPPKPVPADEPIFSKDKIALTVDYQGQPNIATRKAYGNALVKAHEANKAVIALDGDTKNSTFSITLLNKHKDAFVECFIAEQNLVGVATGLAARHKIPFVSTFGAFLIRAADQIRIAGVSHSNIKLVGSHCGCSIGEDGPSQMALEDLAFFRTIPNIVVLYPSDGYSAEKAVELAANYVGPVYIRTSRPETAHLYQSTEAFEVGKCKKRMIQAMW